MKKIFRFLLWLIAMLLIVIVVKTLLFRSLQIKPETVSNISIGNECVDHLAGAIRIPTISYAPDSPVDTAAFNAYHAYIDRTYPLINSKLKKEVFNEFSLLYTWKGKNASLKPVVLMAHMDVVPPGDTTKWERGPFSGYNDGTYIWGRGSLDDKVAMISILESVEKLLSEGYMPERTILLSFGHDEELINRGAKYIASALKERGIEAEYILDEGMAITQRMVPMMKKPVALIGTSGKGYITLKLTVEMPGGHPMAPEMESALIVLNKAIYRIVKNQFAPAISGPVNDFIRYIGPEMPFYAKAIFANKWLFKGIILKIYTGSAAGNALVRTTSAPTVFHAGIKDNVIPTQAESEINFRTLPGSNSSDIIKHIEKVVNDKRVIIKPIMETLREPSPVSPSDSPGFIFLHKTISQVFPETVVASTLVLGNNDCNQFTQVSNNIYRFSPIIVTPEDLQRQHGLNERNKIEDFKKGIGFYYQLIKNSN